MEISRKLHHQLDDVRPVRDAPGIRLHRGPAMLAAAFVLMLVFNAANLPSPLYVIYRHQFHFSEITQTLIFAVYVVGAMLALVVFGRLSDQIGRRPTLFIAIALSALSALLFVFAFDTAMLFAARIFSGFAAGLTATACTAAIAELAPGRDGRLAAIMATGANVMALGIGPLLSGLLAEFLPWPLRLPYLVYLGGLAVPTVVVWMLAEPVKSPKPLREVSLKPRVGVPGEIAGQFIAPAITAFVAFALMGFYSALIPNVLQQSLRIQSHAVGGAVIFFMFGCGAVAIVGLARLSSRAAMFSALGLLLPGVWLLMLAQHDSAMALLLMASAFGGAAGALGYRGSLQVINEIAPPDRRAEIVAVLLLGCYVGISVPVIGVGVLSQLTSPAFADVVFAAVLSVLAVAATVMGWLFSGQPAAASRH